MYVCYIMTLIEKLSISISWSLIINFSIIVICVRNKYCTSSKLTFKGIFTQTNRIPIFLSENLHWEINSFITTKISDFNTFLMFIKIQLKHSKYFLLNLDHLIITKLFISYVNNKLIIHVHNKIYPSSCAMILMLLLRSIEFYPHFDFLNLLLYLWIDAIFFYLSWRNAF